MWHIMTRKDHFTLRLRPEVTRRLLRGAESAGLPKTVLAERCLDEGLRLADHPGIVFRDGPAGRRAGLAGRGLDVWEVIETIQNEGGDVQAAAVYLGIPPALVSIADEYYADYPEEIDEWIECNRAMADEAEAAWRRSRKAPIRR